jgi:AraC-like DNA-binding protein
MTVMKKQQELNIHKYFVGSNLDDLWGMTITTAGFENMKSRDDDPVLKLHPSEYRFKSNKGRILNEFQLLYIIEGSGTFKSATCESSTINAGTMILLFPGEWHSYYPNPQIGWKLYWVGFKGFIIDKWIGADYFSKRQPKCEVGISESIITLCKEIINLVNEDKIGSQQMISGLVMHILGFFYYKNLNHINNENIRLINMLNKARLIMRENLSRELSFEEIAKEIGMGYSWFRRMFKKYEGLSPAQYLIQVRISKIKELLSTTDLSVSEIAYHIGFESKSQFSTYFKKHEGISPSEFKKLTCLTTIHK